VHEGFGQVCDIIFLLLADHNYVIDIGEDVSTKSVFGIAEPLWHSEVAVSYEWGDETSLLFIFWWKPDLVITGETVY
jgi:hypothetical protein